MCACAIDGYLEHVERHGDTENPLMRNMLCRGCLPYMWVRKRLPQSPRKRPPQSQLGEPTYRRLVKSGVGNQTSEQKARVRFQAARS